MEPNMANPTLAVYIDQLPRMVSSNGLSIREDVLFTDAKGRQSDRARKKEEALLEKWRDVLPPLLESNETIFYIVKNCQAPVTPLEQFFLGIYAYGATATALILTNLRIIHLGVTGRGKWRRILKSVRWGDVSEAKIKGWIGKILELKYANGAKARYWKMAGRDAKKVEAILASVLPATRAEATAAQGMVSLCPDCRIVLAQKIYQCQGCKLTFKDEKTLLKRTLLIPGGGYLYAGYTTLGVISLFFEGLFLIEAILYFLMAVGLMPPTPAENGRFPNRADLWVTAGIFLFIIALRKSLEYLHGRRIIRMFLPLNRLGQA
jgi:hypothetical protein